MAKYTIAYKCEHEGEVNIVGLEKERPSKRAWLATQLCPECRRAAYTLDVETWTQKQGLVALAGTEKQVAWANKIRKFIIEDMEEYVESANAHPEHPDADYILRGYKWTLQQANATWWIDRKNSTGRIVLKSMMDKLKDKDAQAVSHA